METVSVVTIVTASGLVSPPSVWYVHLEAASVRIISGLYVDNYEMRLDGDISRRSIVQTGTGIVLLGGLGGIGTATDDHEKKQDGKKTDADHETDEYSTDVGVRAAHLSPDAPDVDIYVDGDPVLEDVPYTAVSQYLDLEPGSYQIQVVPAGADLADAVIDETVDVVDGDYTVAVIGEVAAENQPLQPLLLEDDTSPVPGDMARVRAVHASPDAPAVDIAAGENGDALFENVAFGESGSVEVASGDYTLLIYPAGDRAEPVFEIDVSLEAGAVYSAFAVGYLTPTEAPADEPFDVILTEDTAPNTVTEEEKQTEKK
ncbi:DUF4397 domain-containing protein [Natrialbaceae archaeon A-arb3/5]